MFAGFYHLNQPAVRILCYLVDDAGGVADFRALAAACNSTAGGVSASCRMLERCGWIAVKEPREFKSTRRNNRSEMIVSITPAGRIWRKYLARRDMHPLGRVEMFQRMLALEDVVSVIAAIGVRARNEGAADHDEVFTKLPARVCLLAAEIMHPPPGERPTIYPWTMGTMKHKHEILGNEQPRK